MKLVTRFQYAGRLVGCDFVHRTRDLDDPVVDILVLKPDGNIVTAYCQQWHYRTTIYGRLFDYHVPWIRKDGDKYYMCAMDGDRLVEHEVRLCDMDETIKYTIDSYNSAPYFGLTYFYRMPFCWRGRLYFIECCQIAIEVHRFTMDGVQRCERTSIDGNFYDLALRPIWGGADQAVFSLIDLKGILTFSEDRIDIFQGRSLAPHIPGVVLPIMEEPLGALIFFLDKQMEYDTVIEDVYYIPNVYENVAYHSHKCQEALRGTKFVRNYVVMMVAKGGCLRQIVGFSVSPEVVFRSPSVFKYRPVIDDKVVTVHDFVDGAFYCFDMDDLILTGLGYSRVRDWMMHRPTSLEDYPRILVDSYLTAGRKTLAMVKLDTVTQAPWTHNTYRLQWWPWKAIS